MLDQIFEFFVVNEFVLLRIVCDHHEPNDQPRNVNQGSHVEHQRPSNRGFAQNSRQEAAQCTADATAANHASIRLGPFFQWKPLDYQREHGWVYESQEATEQCLQANQRCRSTKVNCYGSDRCYETREEDSYECDPFATETISCLAGKCWHDAVQIKACS